MLPAPVSGRGSVQQKLREAPNQFTESGPVLETMIEFHAVELATPPQRKEAEFPTTVQFTSVEPTPLGEPAAAPPTEPALPLMRLLYK